MARPRPRLRPLGENEPVRRRRYAEFVREAVDPDEWSLIREAVQRGQLIGTAQFMADVERVVGQRVERRGRGRPSGEK